MTSSEVVSRWVNPIAMRSSNPALSDETFRGTRAGFGADAMTIQGTVNKTGIALLILMATASYTWNLGVGDARVPAFTMVGLLGGLVLAMVTIFKKEWAATTTPMYAALEGLALGGISATFEARYPGLVSQAVFLTFGTLGALLLAYRSGLVRATEQWAAGGELRKRLLAAFSTHGIEIPRPQRVVLARDPNVDPFTPGGATLEGPTQDDLSAGTD